MLNIYEHYMSTSHKAVSGHGALLQFIKNIFVQFILSALSENFVVSDNGVYHKNII